MLKVLSRKDLRSFFLKDEEVALAQIIKYLEEKNIDISQAQKDANEIIIDIKDFSKKKLGIEALLQTYPLKSPQGLGLMMLSESYLRIPDAYTRTKILEDKLGCQSWDEFMGKSAHKLINFATWGLHVTKSLLDRTDEDKNPIENLLSSVTTPSIRWGTKFSMKFIGSQFILGETIEKALSKGKTFAKAGCRFSYDMLGEAAMTELDASRYFQSYKDAILKASSSEGAGLNPFDFPGVSIKLSALFSRYEDTHTRHIQETLYPRILELANLAKEKKVLLTIDAEEADRLETSLDAIEFLFSHPDLKDWEGLGFALQAYQKRAFKVIDWAQELSSVYHKKIYIRLVKGAYWDTEIKRAQERGLASFPVFTRKNNTDLSYLACAIKLMENDKNFYVQLATHNAFTFSLLLPWIKKGNVEMQRLHGMGESLFESSKRYAPNAQQRIYAPVGGHKDLLAYLVRRLLENGANTSFVNQVLKQDGIDQSITQNPFTQYKFEKYKENPMTKTPSSLYNARKNSKGFDLSDREKIEQLYMNMEEILCQKFFCGPIVAGEEIKKTSPHRSISSPSKNQNILGEICLSDEETLLKALDAVHSFFPKWSSTSLEERVNLVMALGDALEEEHETLYTLLIQESGKTLSDAVAEVREAVDFCYYYARQAKKLLETPETLEGPTGELNQLSLHPRGVFLCISPWNFPLAIFLGQAIAALVTGNTVILKPATNTCLIASFVVKLAHKIGIPGQAISLVPASGTLLSKTLLQDKRIQGVVFTGSTQTAHTIQKSLAAKEGAISPFIAETGGLNAMIVDSSALLEQVTKDVIGSAFKSAGQRCSALRLLVVQEDIYDDLIAMIKGAMKELKVGDSSNLDTDVGPVISANAKSNIGAYIHNKKHEGFKVFQETKVPEYGFYVEPTLIELDHINQLEQEVFGPVLHMTKFSGKELEQTVEKVNQLGYGLTMGLHTRIDKTISTVRSLAKIGNLYVNRNMTGAVVGVQPFGGEGMSGTGFKAGGPYYLLKFLTERTFTYDTTSAGGNVTLMTQD